jgi:hypothetical protein
MPRDSRSQGYIRVVRAERKGRTWPHDTVAPPHNLQPTDIHWENSRPNAKWRTGPMIGDYWAIEEWKERQIELVEVSTGDVIDLFCPNGGSVNQRNAAPRPSVNEGVSDVPGAIPHSELVEFYRANYGAPGAATRACCDRVCPLRPRPEPAAEPPCRRALQYAPSRSRLLERPSRRDASHRSSGRGGGAIPSTCNAL